MRQLEVILQDGRRLIFALGAPSRQLTHLAEYEIDAVSDAPFRNKVETEGFAQSDFTTTDVNGNRIAIELKLRATRPKQREVEKWMSQLKKHRNFELFDTVELWVLNMKGSELAVWKEAAQEAPDLYGLINVMNSNYSSESASKDQHYMDSAYIEDRVEKWILQVAELFRKIATWCESAEYNTETKKSAIIDEELMRLYAVEPKKIWVLSVYKEKSLVASLKPKGLWVIGANGRIDIYAESASGMIINDGEVFEPHWVLFDQARNTFELDQQSFIDFLRGNERT